MVKLCFTSRMCEELKQYCDVYGRQKELAKACDVTPQAVSGWLSKGVPPERVLAIEKATDGKVTRYKLRPDIYPLDDEVAA